MADKATLVRRLVADVEERMATNAAARAWLLANMVAGSERDALVTALDDDDTATIAEHSAALRSVAGR